MKVQQFQAHWRGRASFTIFDSGFGDGEQWRAFRQAWCGDPERPARLHYIALASGRLPGFRRIPQDNPALTLDLLYAPLDAALAQLDARLDAICLHDIADQGSGFGRALSRLAVPGAVLHARGLTETQARMLSGVAFECVSAGDGVISAVFTTRKPPSPWARRAEPVRRAIVLGAGLAGAAACERLCARGWHVTLIERHNAAASEASGNRAGIYQPLMSVDDNVMTRLSRAAYLYALDYWDMLGGVGRKIEGAQCAVLKLARNLDVYDEQAVAPDYPAYYARWLNAPEAGALAGVPAPGGAWLFPQAGWVRPASVCTAMLEACGSRLTTCFGVGSVSLAREEGEWVARAAGGEAVAQAPVVIVATGTGARDLAQTSALPLAAVRGQVTHAAAGELPALPFVLCREAYLTPAIDGWHSFGATYEDDADPVLRESSQQANLDKLRSLLGDQGIGQHIPLAGRVGFRCVAPDRLPLVGAVPEVQVGARLERLREVPRQPGLYGLLGYASRGLIWAPLAAELLACQLDSEALPLEAELVTALDPARFVLRARRRRL